LVGRAGLRSSSEMSPCCHLDLLSVQYMDTLEGRVALSNRSGTFVYPKRLPAPNFGPKATRMCFPWIRCHTGLSRKQSAICISWQGKIRLIRTN
jgi:hypothetical protein